MKSCFSIFDPSIPSRHNQNSPTLSYPIQREMEGHNELGFMEEHFDNGLMGRVRDNEEYESRSGSDNFDGASGDDQDDADQKPQQRRKKYHRHTPHQIQELEAFFKECPHPDEKQRADLSRRLNLENKQVKFWFQNRRTQTKNILERHENYLLKNENEKLIVENGAMKEALANPICHNCGGPAIPGQISFEEHQIRIENARLKDELNRICALAHKFLGRPVSSLAVSMATSTPNSGLELGLGRNVISGSSNIGMSFPMGHNLGDAMLGSPPVTMTEIRPPNTVMGNEIQLERTMLIDLALAAMDELIKMAQIDSSLWIKSFDGKNEILDHEEYARMGSPFICPTTSGYVTEGTRETATLIINSSGLVETLMDSVRWSEMFPSIISRAITLDVISSGMAGTRNGALQVMQAEIQFLSPLVPVRQMIFLRFCKQLAEGLWAVVDASVDVGRNFKRLPSGFIVQDTPNGLSKITWVEHSQYDESVVHQLYRPMVNSGLAFGAHRWIATLQRQCECLALHMSNPVSSEDPSITQVGRRSIMRFAQRMIDNFFSGICPSAAHKWDTHHLGTLGDDMKVMTKKSIDVPGEPSNVLCAATSVRIPVSREKVFSFLCGKQVRNKWDILCNNGPTQELLHIAKGQVQGNCISVLRSNNANNGSSEGNDMLVLQETWSDTSCSVMVYAPVHMHSLNMVMDGGDCSYVTLLPSGFAIHPDGLSVDESGDNGAGNGGCLLTVGFQILHNSLPTERLTAESVDTVEKLISSTIERIKDALKVA